MELSDLHSPPGAFKKRKRVGRGPGSGTGKTAGRGQKGQKSRSGHHYMPAHFVGGQTPLQQQLPYKRGFKNNFKKVFVLVNLDQLAAIETEGDLTPDVLVAAGLIRNTRTPVKILAGEGEVTRALRVSAHKVSVSARQAIEAAGGSVTLLGPEAGAADETDATPEAGA